MNSCHKGPEEGTSRLLVIFIKRRKMSEVVGALRGSFLGGKEVANVKITIFMDTVKNEGLNELLV